MEKIGDTPLIAQIEKVVCIHRTRMKIFAQCMSNSFEAVSGSINIVKEKIIVGRQFL